MALQAGVLSFLIAVSSLVFSNSTLGSPYIGAELGAPIVLEDPEAGFSLGGQLGYAFGEILAVEASYKHFFMDTALDLIEGRAKVGLPLVLVKPYGIIGGGLLIAELPGADGRGIFRIGGGLSITLLPAIQLYLEGSYLTAGDDFQYFEPLVGIRLGG